MNLSIHAARARRSGASRVRIGQIGAGKFGTMFLSQVRLTPGMHLVGLADLMPARARERLSGVGWPKEQIAAKSLGDALKSGKTFVTDDAMAVIAQPRDRRRDRGDRRSGAGITLCQAAIAARQAHRHGQRRGRRAGRARCWRGKREGGGRRLLAGLGRPAGADLRARRLGARLRLQGGRRRQGHALPPDLPPLHARYRVGDPRRST